MWSESILLSAVLGAILGAAPQHKGESPPGTAAVRTEFVIESEFGSESDWVKPYLEEVARELVTMLDNPAVTPLPKITVSLKKEPTSKGLRGRASGTKKTLYFWSSIWPREKYRLWIMAHELANLFAAHYGGAGGFPADWWANGRSPFPLYTSCLVMKRLGFLKEAEAIKARNAADPDQLLYWDLDQRYGFKLFATFLKLLRDDGINLAEIGARWPSPDKLRSTYTIAYLSLAAERNLAALVQKYGIGKKPKDWEKRHPEISFAEYVVSPKDVAQVVKARKSLFGKDARPEDDGLRQAYRKGAYEEVFEKRR